MIEIENTFSDRVYSNDMIFNESKSAISLSLGDVCFIRTITGLDIICDSKDTNYEHTISITDDDIDKFIDCLNKMRY